MNRARTARGGARDRETPSTPEAALILLRRALAEPRSAEPVFAAALVTAMDAIYELSHQVDELQTALATQVVVE